MNLKRIAPLLLTIVLTMTACTPFNFLGLPHIPAGSDKVIIEPPSDELSGNELTEDSRSVRDIAVFYTEHEPGYPDSEMVMTEHHDKMSGLMGFWYQVDPMTYGLLNAAGHPSHVIEHSKSMAEGYGLDTEMLVYNFLYGSTEMSQNVLEQLMTSLRSQDAFIANLTHLARARGYKGVSIDFEHLRPAYRESFSNLIDNVAQALRDYGLSSSISVGAKTWDDPNNGWAGGYDYRRLGEAVDRFVLMTYDEHGFSSGPGPIASAPWVEQVLQYATTQVPPEKIMVGIAGYGFDWNAAGGAPRYLAYEQAEALRQRVGAQLQWDDTARMPFFTYVDVTGNAHEVWYEDASSASWKLDLIDRYDLRGMALWRLGLEDPAFWDLVSQKFIPM